MNFEDTFARYKGKNTRQKIVNYIRENYRGLLGDDVELLGSDQGLEEIQRKYFRR